MVKHTQTIRQQPTTTAILWGWCLGLSLVPRRIQNPVVYLRRDFLQKLWAVKLRLDIMLYMLLKSNVADNVCPSRKGTFTVRKKSRWDGLSQKEDMVFSLFSKTTTKLCITIKSGIVHRISTIRNLISNHSIYAKYLLNFTSPKPLLLVYFFLWSRAFLFTNTTLQFLFLL